MQQLRACHPTKEQGEMMGAYFKINGAVEKSLEADGLPRRSVQLMGLGLRDAPDDLLVLLRAELGHWLSTDANDSDFLQVIQHGGLSARARRIGRGDSSYVDVEVGVALGARAELANFGKLADEHVMTERVIGYAKKWNRSLPEEPIHGEVLATMYGNPRAAWEYMRHQLDTQPQWVAHAAEELQGKLGLPQR